MTDTTDDTATADPAAELLRELRAIRALLAESRHPPGELLDRPGLAAALNVGVSTLDKLAAAGEIGPRPFKVGGGVRWHRAEVRLWLGHRDGRGELYDADRWPAVLADLQRRNATGRK